MSVPMLQAVSLIDPQVKAGFHIESSIKYTTPLHYHDYYEIFIITSGKCIHKTNNENQFLEKGTMVFIRPNDQHSYDYYGDSDCQFMNVNFYKELAEDAFNYFEDRIFVQNLVKVELPPHVTLPQSEIDILVRKCQQLNLYLTIDKLKAKVVARSFLIDALTYFFVNDHNKNPIILPDWFDALLLEMQKKENFTLGLEKLHEISGKSMGHLNRVFKQYLNTTPTTYINHLKLRYAKNLLITTNLSILDVSFEAGFENLSHFYHLFRKSFGISPGKIRSKKERSF